jgi:hypothetical protein
VSHLKLVGEGIPHVTVKLLQLNAKLLPRRLMLSFPDILFGDGAFVVEA